MVRGHVLIHFATRQLAPAAVPTLAPTFDDVMTRLIALGDCFCEPDGSFAWRGETADEWQVFGQLHDGRSGLDSVELRGSCPRHAWDAFLELLGAAPATMRFQLLPGGTFVDCETVARTFAGDNA